MADEGRRPEKLSAGVIVTQHDSGEWQVLLLRCYGYWDFPKGELAAGEDPLNGALRETVEETGLDDLDFPWGMRFYQTPPYSRGKAARYYLATSRTRSVTLGVNRELGRPEHHEHRWATFAEAESVLNERLRAALSWAAQIIAAGPPVRPENPGEPPCPTSTNR